VIERACVRANYKQGSDREIECNKEGRKCFHLK